MAYSKTEWKNGETPVNAANMNKIETGIFDISSAYIKNAELLDSNTKLKLTKQDDTVIEFQGGGSGPSEYIKSASVSGKTLTLTEKDGTTQVKFDPKGYDSFPSDFVVNDDMVAFISSVLKSSSFEAGRCWAGTLNFGDDKGMPVGIATGAECLVTAIWKTSDTSEGAWRYNIANVEIFSDNVAPYHWEYHTRSAQDVGDPDYNWKVIPEIRNDNMPEVPAYSETSVSRHYVLGLTTTSPTDPLKSGTYTFKPEEAEATVWSDVEITADTMKRLTSGQQIVGTLPTAFNPKDFRNTRVFAYLNNTGTSEGQTIAFDEEMQKLYIDLAEGSLENSIPYIAKFFDMGINGYSFAYNYYKSFVLWAGGQEKEYKERKGEEALDGKNVIYVQDITQQKWEINPEGDKPYVAPSREQLEADVFGGAYVISIKGKDAANSKAFILCLADSQAAYWDTTIGEDGDVRWANIYAGKTYPVYFDTEYGTQRWLLSEVETDPEALGAKKGVEMTAADITALKTTGLEMDADETIRYSKAYLEDTSIKLFTECIGNDENTLALLFSWNSPFVAPADEHYFEIIGDPRAYMPEQFEYEVEVPGEEKPVHKTEKKGVYIWDINLFGDSLNVIIPASADPEMKTFIAEMGGNSTATNTIYRHTVTIKPAYPWTHSAGDYTVWGSAMAVNCSYADNSWNYLLWSDASSTPENTTPGAGDPWPDWIIPFTGQIGVYNGAGSTPLWTFYPAVRMKGMWHNVAESSETPNWQRYLSFDYIDPTQDDASGIKTAHLISGATWNAFQLGIFDSIVGDFVIG